MRIYEFGSVVPAAGKKQELPYSKTDPDRLEFIPLIEKHCSEALDAMRQARKPLYRGFRSAPANAFIGSPREARNTYTSKSVVELFNENFERAGIAANRSNSMSTTSSAINANAFGDLFYIFPVNGFKFSWSPMVNDFGSMFGDYNDIEDFLDAYPGEGSLVDEFDYTDKHFDAALKSGNEINILGRYVAFSTEVPIFGQEHVTLAHRLGIN